MVTVAPYDCLASYVQAAIRLAQQEWREGSSRYRVVGDLVSMSHLGRGQLFYTVSLGSEATPELEAFAEAYNNKLARLVVEKGLPRWAPSARVPSRSCVLQMLGVHTSPTLPAAQLPKAAERSVLYWVDFRAAGGASTVRFRFVAESKVVLFGGDLSPRCGLVDSIDTTNGLHMKRYEFRRSHTPTFPWDKKE